MVDEINQYLAKALQAALEEGLTEEAFEKAKKQLAELVSGLEADLTYGLKQRLADELSDWTTRMASRVVLAILNGDENLMRQYLSCTEYGWNGRSNTSTDSSALGAHPIIHGNLFENNAVLLRKKIVDAHRDLLVNERILDLEDQVKSLVEQVNQANAARDEMWRRTQ